MTSPQIHQLEEQVKQSNQQIEQLTKKLETAAEAMEKTAARFGELEHKVAQRCQPASGPEGPHSSPPGSAAKPSHQPTPLGGRQPTSGIAVSFVMI